MRSRASSSFQFECTFQRGNVFLSMLVRIFLPPDPASGQFHCADKAAQQHEDAFLVEAQMREGDRLYHFTLFRELMKRFRVGMATCWAEGCL